MAAQDVEAGRAYVSLYLKRADYDQQVDDLKRNEESNRPSAALDIQGGEQQGERPGLNRIAKFLGLKGDIGNMIGLLRMFRDSANDASPSISTLGLAAAKMTPIFAGMASEVTSVGSATRRVKPLFGHTAEALQVMGSAFGVFRNAVFGIPKVIGSAIGVMRKMSTAFLETAAAAENASAKATKVAALAVAAPAFSAAAAPAFSAAATAAKKTAAAVSFIPRAMLAAAGQVAASAGKIAKQLARMPGQLIKATSAAIQSVGISLAKIGAITAGITATIVGSATLAAKSWAAYGEKIRGVQNDLLRFQLTAEEASIIARVSEQTGESAERLAQQLRDGTRDFSRWRNELRQSGMMMTGPQLAAALALSRAYFSLRKSVLGLKLAIGDALGPVLTENAELFTGMVRGITKWVSENRPLVVQVFKIASAVGVAAGVITALGGAIAGVGTVISPFVAGLALLAGVMAVVEVRTEAGRSIWAAYGDSVRRVAGTVTQHLGDMMAFADSVIGGVVDALIAGDLAGAVDVMWAAAKVVWFTSLREIDDMTGGLFSGLIESLAAGRWSAAASVAMNALQIAWLAGVNVLAGVWDQVVDAADAAWTGILTTFDSMITSLKSGLADFLGFAIKNVFFPLMKSVKDFNSILGLKAKTAVFQVTTILMDVRLAALKSARDDEEGEDTKRAKRQGESDERRLQRQPGVDARRVAREEEITRLKQRQDELAKQTGAVAEQERSKAQKALDAAIAAAEAARKAADGNKLQERDFAVSQDVQSIARFSGEALGLSVGRGNDPASKTARLAAEQLDEVKGLRADIVANQRELLRLVAIGGFSE